MLSIASVLSRHVHGRTLGLGSTLCSGWIHPGRQLTVIFRRQTPSSGFLQGRGNFQKALCLQSAESAYAQVALLRPCSPDPVLAYPSQCLLREVSVHFQGRSSLPWWSFPLSRAISTLINWKLNSFGPLDICVLPPKGTVILVKKRWRLFICRDLWPSPTFKLQHCCMEGKENSESARVGCRLS